MCFIYCRKSNVTRKQLPKESFNVYLTYILIWDKSEEVVLPLSCKSYLLSNTERNFFFKYTSICDVMLIPMKTPIRS